MINNQRSYLLVQACSATKHDVDHAVPAFELYDGYFYRIIKNSMYGQREGPSVQLRILSAEHGILEPETEIEPYDRRMTPDRAEALRPEVVDTLATIVECNDFDEVILNLGQDYRPAVEGLAAEIDLPVTFIEGSGIGKIGQQLKRFLNGEPTALRGEA